MTKDCKTFISRLTPEDRWNVLENAVQRLIDIGEVRYRQDDYDVEEGLIWRETGESLTDPPSPSSAP